jgi:protein-arginine kinase activator protein McsA
MSGYTTIGLCHICHSSGVKVALTKIGEKNGMVTQISICEKCRD